MHNNAKDLKDLTKIIFSFWKKIYVKAFRGCFILKSWLTQWSFSMADVCDAGVTDMLWDLSESS